MLQRLLRLQPQLFVSGIEGIYQDQSPFITVFPNASRLRREHVKHKTNCISNGSVCLGLEPPPPPYLFDIAILCKFRFKVLLEHIFLKQERLIMDKFGIKKALVVKEKYSQFQYFKRILAKMSNL